MESYRNFVQKGNEMVCGTKAPLHSICASSLTTKKKNYVLLVVGALLFQYVLPALTVFLFIPLIIGTGIGVGIITLLTSAVNPLFMLGLIPLFLLNFGLAVLIIVGAFIVTIIYYVYYFRQIGILAIVPILMWIVAAVISVIPIFGGILSFVISVVPWMALMAIAHYYAYSEKTMLG